MELLGVYVPLITPFKNDEVDEPGLRRLVDHLITEGVTGFVPCGTTGESATISHDEHKRVIEIVVEHTAKRVPVIAGAGSNSTAEALDLTLHAEKVGADATLQVCPYYNRPSQQGIIAHFKELAAATKLPMVLYNIPKRTGILMEADTVLELSKVPSIVGIKQSGVSLSDTMKVIQHAPDLAVLSGDDNLAFPIVTLGAKGAIAASAHIATREWVKMVELLQDGKLKEACAVHYRLLPLAEVLFMEPNPAPLKAALEMLGLPAGPPRLPILPASENCRERIRKVLYGLGLDVKS
ncbi:MAG: 4-hydroxy-tetrahydrodipicolinate synthase [Armatimonadetes bacterium]|nr:4-hydroxy-tetrahydrodipicolinate synthase [Armatimonadota bacterium]NIM24168.1 4-hydroxy-tetrahydrodipicolinate synthase [Armatimonadota bacterium]NIM68027.1 4-hydroxy-tetrahydrodipicolinate synthase [Armatimonadota bacterium]NIM76522.1 4-hydroxy-tetrahydrodipicolinate synthase [Armatimonadota bacterium]NIN06261.1 4-hydroxy-tetrahydrodipicolinate synthase [Armatimonadota bacterium]